MCAVLAVDYLLGSASAAPCAGGIGYGFFFPRSCAARIILSIWNPLTIHAITKGPAQGVADRLKLVVVRARHEHL